MLRKFTNSSYIRIRGESDVKDASKQFAEILANRPTYRKTFIYIEQLYRFKQGYTLLYLECFTSPNLLRYSVKKITPKDLKFLI